MENSNIAGNAKKTLMNSIDRLNNIANRAEVLSNLSSSLIDKFERKEEPIGKGCNSEKDTLCKKPDIIDLLNGISDRLNIFIAKTGENISNTIDRME